MSIKSHTDDQSNSHKNDHTPGVEYCDESDTWECLECNARKFDEESALRCCADGDDNEGQEPREVLADRLREAGLSTKRFIDVYEGEKRSTNHDQHEPNDERISGNYGTYAGPGAGEDSDGWLVDVDIDDYDGEHDTDALDELSDTFTVESPHGGEHRYYKVTGDVVAAMNEVTDGKDNAGPSWGEVRVKNQYIVGPGSQLEKGEDGCNKEWCDRCKKPDGGYYSILHDRPIASITAEELADVVAVDEKYADKDNKNHSGASVDTQEDRGGGSEDFDVEERLDHGLDNDRKLRRLWNGDFSNYRANDGSCDRSAGIHALIQKLAFWFGKDKKLIGRLMDRANPPKWGEWKDDSEARSRELDAVYRVDETYNQSNTTSLETREAGREYDTVADALVEDTERWIDPAENIITAYPVGEQSADAVAESLKNGELPGDESVVKTAGALDSEYQSAFLDFCNDSDEWTVTTPEGGDEWRGIRQAYADSNMSNKQARDKAFRRLTEEYSFATFEDTGELLVYNSDKGIYEESGKTLIRSQLNEGLQDQYTKEQVGQLVHRIESDSSCKRDEFGADETNPQVCVANGVLDLSEIGSGDENAEVGFYDHSPNRKFLTRLPVEYDPDAECPNFEEFLDDVLGNETDKQLIYEVLGYCLWPSYPFAKALFLYGDGANGKSTLLDVFSELLGTENVSNRSMVALEEDRYAKADLYGSFANIAGDLSNQTLKRTGTLKTLTGGDSVTADEKYKQPFSFKNRAKLVFAANDPPKIEDESSALYRRLLLVNFPNEFTPEGQPGPDAKPKHQLMQEIASNNELSGILNKALSALAGVFERGNFSQNGGAKEVREHYKKISDPVYAFAQACIKEEQGTEVPKEKVYEAYNDWAWENDAPTKDNSVLSRDLQSNVKASSGKSTIDGDRVQAYKGIQIMND